MSGYTVGELERDTGFSRRTIAYYVQLGLLPRVGRMGPKTRYPEQVRDRLRFIRRVREAQEAGEVPPVSLSDIGDVFERAPPELVSNVADGRTAVTPETLSPPSPAFSAPSRRRAALEDRLEVRGVREADAPYVRERIRGRVQRYAAESEEFFARSSHAPPGPEERVYGQPLEAESGDDLELAESMAELEAAAGARDETRRSSVKTWSRIEITSDIALSVRGLPAEDAQLLETVGRKLRRLIRRGQDLMS